MLPWGETRAISKSLLSFCLFCLKRSLVKKATLPISFLTTCAFFCFYWENVAKKKSSNILKEKKERTKKSFVFATCLTALKGVLSFLKQSSFWTKIENKDLLILLVSFLLPLFLLQTSIWFCSTKKTKTICLLKPFFFWQMRKRKEKKLHICFWNQLSVVSFWKKKWVLSCCCCWQAFPKKFKRK